MNRLKTDGINIRQYRTLRVYKTSSVLIKLAEEVDILITMVLQM